MSERYSRLFAIEENLYIEGSPVIISAGALLKDSENDELIGQIKFINICDKIIKGLSVVLELKDSANRATGESVNYMYLDLNVKRNDTFGSKTPIKISNKLVRGFVVKITEVIYKDNSVWKCESSEEWKLIPKQVSLKSFLGDEELFEQYTLDFNRRAEFKYLEDRDLWFCCCGSANNKTEDKCSSCGTPIKISENINIYDLNESLKKRKAKERELQEAKDKERTLILQKEEKRNKMFIVTGIGVAILVVSFLVLYFAVLKPSAEKKNMYEEANSLYDQQNYVAAKEKYEELGDYKDSADKSQISEEKTLEDVKKLVGVKNYYDAAILLEEYGLSESENDLYNECKYNAILSYSKGEIKGDFDLDTIDQYIDDLCQLDYKNINDMYEKLYSWKIRVQDTRITILRGPKDRLLNITFKAYDDDDKVVAEGEFHNLSRRSSELLYDSMRVYPAYVEFTNIDTGETWKELQMFY